LVEAEDDRGDGQGSQRHASHEAHRGAGGPGVGLAFEHGRGPGFEVGGFDPAEVIVDGNHHADDGDGDEGVESSFEGGDKDEELAHEAGQRGDTRERTESDGEDRAEEGMRLGEAGVVFEVLVGVVGTGDVGHHAEDGERCQQVGEEIKVNRTGGEGLAAGGDDRDEQVTGMRNAGEADEALHVVLGERGEVAEEDGRDGHHGEHRHREEIIRAEDALGEDEEHRETGGLGGDGEERGDRGRRALVNVGNPDLEGDGADLEGDTGEDEHDADGGEEVLGVGFEEHAEGVEVHRFGGGAGERRVAGDSVEEDDAEEQDAGAERAGDQVFEAGFEGQRARAEIGDEDVETDGDGFEGDEEEDEVVALREEHHRGGDDHRDGEELDLRHLLLREGDHAEDAHEDRREHEEAAHELAFLRVAEESVERLVGRDGGAVEEVPCEAEEEPELADNGQRGNHGVVFLRQENFQHEEEEREAAEGNLGGDGRPFVGLGSDLKKFGRHGRNCGLLADDGDDGALGRIDGFERGVERGRKRLGPETDEEEGGDQDERGNLFAPAQVGRGFLGQDFGERFGVLAEEDLGGGAESVDRGDHHARHGEDGEERGEFPSGDEDREFAPEVGETGETNAGHRGGDEERGEDRGLLGEATHFVEVEGLRAVIDAGRKEEHQRDGKTVGDHHEDHAARAGGGERRDAEEGVAHVHDRAVTDHLLEVALGDGDETDDEQVAGDGEPGERHGPVGGTEREERNGDLDETVEAEFFEHTGVEHRGGTGRGTVTERSPRMEGPERNEDTEAEHQEAKDVVLRAGFDAAFEERSAQGDEVEVLGTALVVDGDETEEREHRAGGEIDRHLHRGVSAVFSAPDADHDEGRDEREFVEEIEEEDVHAGEDTHQAALHDEEEGEVGFEAFGSGLDRVESGGETDETGEHVERERDAVETEGEFDAEVLESGVVALEELVAGTGARREVIPHVQRDERGREETEGGDDLGDSGRQTGGNHRGGREGRHDGEQKKMGEHDVEKEGSRLVEPAAGEGPEDRRAEEEPVNVGVQAAGVERTRAESDEADRAGESANDEAGEENAFEEFEEHREALLDLGDVVAVGGVEGALKETKEREEHGRLGCKGVGRGGLVEDEGCTGAERHDGDADDEDRGVG
jgi:hypothetical protein